MPTWGDHKGSGRRHARRKTGGRRKTDRARHRRKKSCAFSLFVITLVSCGLWAAVLVPLILWGPL